ncbi:SDR family oxidoreductase [Desulfosporosinus sp. SYSU MS00001]|uniref:SDR family oxidoreductase n=1 Tax=Desulfosporosinus sp. SYSU MS00001 TaxID=3416284 RepID=UPI003CEF8500
MENAIFSVKDKIVLITRASEGIGASLAKEMPTAVMTPSRQRIVDKEIMNQILQRIPMGRVATKDDLIGTVLYLASSASDFVTGKTIFVDGGWTAK